MKRLIIQESPGGTIGQGFDWPRQSSGCLAKKLEGADILRKLLSRQLRNCRSFLIHSYDEYELRLESNCLVPSDAVSLILSIIAEAGLAPRSFTICSSRLANGRLDTLRLPISPCKTPRFIEAWSQIEEFELDYGVTSDQFDWVLLLISSAPRLRKLSLYFFEVDISVLQRLSVLHGLNKLEKLQLKYATTTLNDITSILLRNCDSLHSLSLQYVNLDGEGQWSTVFKNMENQFPHLQNLVLFWLKQGNDHGRVIFSQFLQYPVVPGLEVRGPQNRLKDDSRWIESMEDVVTLRYWGTTGKMVVGVEYHGKEIDHVLSALANTVETN